MTLTLPIAAHLFFLIVAAIAFLLATFNVPWPKLNLVALGLFFVVCALIW